jgi:hypothetical protein
MRGPARIYAPPPGQPRVFNHQIHLIYHCSMSRSCSSHSLDTHIQCRERVVSGPAWHYTILYHIIFYIILYYTVLWAAPHRHPPHRPPERRQGPSLNLSKCDTIIKCHIIMECDIIIKKTLLLLSQCDIIMNRSHERRLISTHRQPAVVLSNNLTLLIISHWLSYNESIMNRSREKRDWSRLVAVTIRPQGGTDSLIGCCSHDKTSRGHRFINRLLQSR